jgi:outer membrane receptor protein involved in Fe transport
VNNLAESRFKTQTLTVGATQSFTPTVSNETRANYSRSEGGSILRIDELGGAVPPLDPLLFPPFTTREDALFSFGILLGRGLVVGKNVGNIQRQINLVDNLSVVAGAHQVKFGGDYRLLLPVNGPRTYNQSVNFSGLTGTTGAITGTAQRASVGTNETVSLQLINFSAYAQDTWKATSRLTLTYGLRWDVNPAPKGRNGKDLFVLETPVNPAALRFTPRGTPLFETTYNNFAPRVGGA